jgi:hypothetical protein
MATLVSIVDALLPDFINAPTTDDNYSTRTTRFNSMGDLLLLGDYEQHLTAITSGSSSAIYAVSPLVCSEPLCEPTIPCGECKFAQQFLLRVYHMKGTCSYSTTDSHALGEKCFEQSYEDAQHKA